MTHIDCLHKMKIRYKPCFLNNKISIIQLIKAYSYSVLVKKGRCTIALTNLYHIFLAWYQTHVNPKIWYLYSHFKITTILGRSNNKDLIDKHKGIFLQLSFEQRKKSRANKKSSKKSESQMSTRKQYTHFDYLQSVRIQFTLTQIVTKLILKKVGVTVEKTFFY